MQQPHELLGAFADQRLQQRLAEAACDRQAASARRPRARAAALVVGLLALALLAGCGQAAVAAPPLAAGGAAAATPAPFLPASGTPGWALPAGWQGTPIARQPAALSAGAVAANSDGSCPADHPIKAVRLGQTYHQADQTSYARVRAAECFATAADAEAAGYRAAAR
ncbi:MAG TPA: hypothetical protein VFL91_01320 [Thermomicrobiales bacterium]|nr:hypothetical protein [Thermomicrobiales bacterium]